jgi:hypothetical protein
MKIRDTALIFDHDSTSFYKKLNENIADMQIAGLEVEVQYRVEVVYQGRGKYTSVLQHTALLIGREA